MENEEENKDIKQPIPYCKWKRNRLDFCIAVTSISKYKLSVLSLSQVLKLDYKLKSKITTLVLANKEPKS